MRTTIRIGGMNAVHAVRGVWTALAAIDGLTSAEVSLGRATLESDAPLPLTTLRQMLATMGYTVDAVTEERRGLPVRDEEQ